MQKFSSGKVWWILQMIVELSKFSLIKFCTYVEIFCYCISILVTWLSSSRYVGTWNFEVISSVLDKKDLPENKELPVPSGPLSKTIPSLLIASYNAGATKVLKQAKWSVIKNQYTKLTPAIVGSPHPYPYKMWKARAAVIKENRYISQPL